MPKRDSDLFDRLRRAGVRKEVAKMLSELGEGAGRKATQAGRSAVAELRSLADEIEKRLPGVAAPSPSRVRPRAPAPARRTASRTVRASGSRAAAGARQRTKDAAPASARTRRAATKSAVATPRAPRGQNKAKILGALKAGPRTASEIAEATGIGTGTVSATLTKMTKAGEVTKAARGYALPTAPRSRK